MKRSLLLKIVVSVGLVVAAVAIVLYTAGKSKGLFRFVDEVQAQAKKLQDKEIWMAGDLKPNSHRTKTEGQRERHRFVMTYRGSSIDVYYTGAWAQNARPGRQLVVRGKLKSNGSFEADEIRTKCPSKYKSQYEARK